MAGSSGATESCAGKKGCGEPGQPLHFKWCRACRPGTSDVVKWMLGEPPNATCRKDGWGAIGAMGYRE